jgi:hypothetical protein
VVAIRWRPAQRCGVDTHQEKRPLRFLSYWECRGMRKVTIPCPACRHEVAGSAPSCPYCGHALEPSMGVDVPVCGEQHEAPGPGCEDQSAGVPALDGSAAGATERATARDIRLVRELAVASKNADPPSATYPEPSVTSPSRLTVFAILLVCGPSTPADAGWLSRGSTDRPWWRPCGPGDTYGGNRLIPQGAFGVDARPACEKHDECYRDATTDRKTCDEAFLNDLRCACENSIHPRLCKRAAKLAYFAVRVGGRSSYGRP